MMNILIFIYEIDISILLKEIKASSKHPNKHSRTGFRDTFLEMIRPLLPTLASLAPTRRIIAKQITNFAIKYGMKIRTHIEKNETYIQSFKEGNKNCMLTLSASIANVDYQKILKEIQKNTSSNGNNSIMNDVINIIEPFAAETMKTIPPAAFAELFMLLGKDKIIEMAGKYGVELSDLSMDGRPNP